MKVQTKFSYILMGLMLLMSCEQHIGLEDSERCLVELMNKSSVTHFANGFKVELKPVHKDYLALKELQSIDNPTEMEYDAAMNKYSQGKYFILIIGPEEDVRKGDVMMQDIKDYDAYKKRFVELSFDLDNMLLMEFGEFAIKPVLVNTEHSFGLSDYRTAMIAFVPENKQQKMELDKLDPIKVSFNDKIFQTGINYFQFDGGELESDCHFDFKTISI